MKKIVYGMAFFSLLFFVSELWAQEGAKPIAINGKSWTVKVRLASGKGKASGENDSLIFSDGKFASQNFAAKGYPATGYSVRVENDGSTIWEAMQTKEGGTRLLWHGVVNPENMQMNGVLCKQSERGEMQDFTFTSTGVK